MSINNLAHYLIRAENTEKTKYFYVDVLGMIDGRRPEFGFPGHWFYANGQPLVHIVPAVASQEQAAYLSQKAFQAGQDTGAIDHIAFSATNVAEMKALLQRSNIFFEERIVPQDKSIQLFLRDPNGIKVELNFPY